MKRAIFTITAICSVAFFLIGADYRSASNETKVRKHCSGYTIIEAGTGIDCYGDTVKLVKRSGFYELASKSKN
jgi:hypothetical protein